jgi:hypothetical protein
MKKKTSIGGRGQVAFLTEIAGLWPVAKGSLAEVRKPCGRKNCSTCGQGRKHPAFIFAFRRDGKTLCRYVPRELVPRLRQAIANGRRLEERLAQVGETLILEHREKLEGRARGHQ